MKSFFINNFEIGSNSKPFIIAEMSGNHNQSIDRAIKIVEEAAKAGAHALKLQTYTADTMTLNINKPEFMINDPKSLWNGRNLYELYQEAHTPWEWHKPIFEACKSLGLLAFSTPFDETAVDFLETLNVPCYKVASFELTDIPLLKKIATTKKPVIMSTGMATITEISEAVSTLKNGGCENIVLLKCTSSYPSSPEYSNILTIPNMRDTFQVQVGLSDHTMGVGVSIAAIALGATVIEKHFTLSRAEGGVDSAFSLEPSELKSLVVETERAWLSLGKIRYEPTETEKKYVQFRRSIYASKDINKGETLNSNNLRVIRPAHGLEPKYFDLVQGKKSLVEIKRGTPLSWDLIGG